MAIILNDNIKINAGKPIDSRYLTTGNTAYISLPAVCAAIPIAERYLGLTVLVDTGTTSAEYWFREDVSTLIPKTIDINIPEGDFITGATNLGYFSGTTGLQSLCITPYSTFGSNYTCYAGDYESLFNYYYRDCEGIIRIGEPPSDYIPKRGYVHNPTILNPNYKSWVWNEYTGSSNCIGWILIDGNIANLLGTFQYGCTYYTGGTSQPFINTSWSTPGSSGTVNIIAVEGSLSTGNTLVIGARSFACAEHNNLHFRTIISETPALIKVWDDDDTLIHLSGASAVLSAANAGTGENIFLGQTGTTLYFKRITGSGDTVVSTLNNEIIVYSVASGGTGGGTITGATNLGTGVGVYDSVSGKTLQFDSLVGSGGTMVQKIGNEVIICSTTAADSQLYSGQTPSAVNLCGITIGYDLTGKTVSQILQDLLVPELFQTSVGTPATTAAGAGGTYEIGCSLSLTITPTYTAGAISPLYCTTGGATRGGSANAYQYIGCCLPDTGFITNTFCTVNPYVVSAGTQTWCVRTRYDEGACIKGSKGTVNPSYPTACPLNSTTPYGTTSLNGLYPYFYGVSAGVPTPGSALLATCLGKSISDSTGTLYITYGAQTAKYLWFATPNVTTKQGWYEGATNKGNIGSPSDLFDAPTTLSVNSPDSCWTNISYKFYVSNYSTSTSANVYCMTNAQQQ